MPRIYLSPSTQEKNIYYDNSGSEEYYMNLIADALIPYLVSNGIEYTRNTPDMTAASSIVQSNHGNYDLHLALHSNAAAGENSGKVRGSIVFYYPNSSNGKRFAEIVADNLKIIYPNPNLVRATPTTSLGEVANTTAPSVLIELAFHDNPEDAEWIKNNIDNIARNLAISLSEYFGIPFAEPMTPREGEVRLRFGRLNIRSRPSIMAPIVGTANNGEKVTVLGEVDGWYVIRAGNTTGYVKSNYII